MSNVHLGPRTLIVPFTSDRGLCGGINSGLIREIKGRIAASPNRSDFGFFSLGEKGYSAINRHFADLLKMSISDISTPINYFTMASIGEQINNVAQTNGYDRVTLYYNEFKSAIKYNIRQVELLPRNRFMERMKLMKLYKQSQPDAHTSNPALFDLYFSSNIYNAYLNNIASEQSARMTAMENASKNAKKIVEVLKLEYNKARQAKITMELCEIISGAAAV